MTTTGFDVAFIYNKTIFSELGVEPPKTWPELKSILDKALAANYIPFFAELGDRGIVGGQISRLHHDPGRHDDGCQYPQDGYQPGRDSRR